MMLIVDILCAGIILNTEPLRSVEANCPLSEVLLSYTVSYISTLTKTSASETTVATNRSSNIIHTIENKTDVKDQLNDLMNRQQINQTSVPDLWKVRRTETAKIK